MPFGGILHLPMQQISVGVRLIAEECIKNGRICVLERQI
jgi:hypothetical protein